MEKGPKESIPVSDLDEIFRVLKEKRSDVSIRKDSMSIVIEEGSKILQVNKKGIVRGSMPLHSFYTQSAKSIKIGEKDIEVHSEDGEYVFQI